MNCKTQKLVLGIVIGVVAAVALFCLAVAIGCAVNGLNFGEQICQWFGKAEEVAEEVADTSSAESVVSAVRLVTGA